MNIKKIAFLFTTLFFSNFCFSSNFEGYFVNEDLDYPAFIGECSALLTIYMQGGEKQETYERNYQKYITLINNLNDKDKNRSFTFQDSFINEISKIKSPNEEEYWGLRNDMSVCAYWTGFKKYQHFLATSN